MFRIALSVCMLSVVAGVSALNWVRSPMERTLDWTLFREPPEVVRTERPRRGPIRRSITSPGLVESVGVVHLTSPRPGRVAMVHVENGDLVEAGQVLVTLDDEGARRRLDEAEVRRKALDSEIPPLETALQKDQNDLALQRQYLNSGYQPPTNLADTPTRVAKARAELDAKRAERAALLQSIAEARALVEQSELKAQAAGVVDGLIVRPGDQVGPAIGPSPPLLRILDPAALRVRCLVDEADVHLVAAGQTARIAPQADPKLAIAARVERVAVRGEMVGDVIGYETIVAIEGTTDRLRAGMRTTVEIDVQEAAEALTVPIQAVVHRRRRDLPDTPALRSWSERARSDRAVDSLDPALQYVKAVFVVEGDAARLRPVETGLSDRRRVEVTWGLEPDEEVVTGPFRALDELTDSEPVVRERTDGEPVR